MSSTQWPQHGGDVSWELLRSSNYLENNVRLNAGQHDVTWELQQLLSVQHRDATLRLAVVCKRRGVDWLAETTIQTGETTLGGQATLRLSAGRQWSGQVELVRQDHQPGRRYGGRLELVAPKVTRSWRVELSQHQQQTQWDFVAEYVLNKRTEAAFNAIYRNLSSRLMVSSIYWFFMHYYYYY